MLTSRAARKLIDDSVRAVFFDAVGTLLHPRVPPSQTYVAAALRCGAAIPEPLVRLRFASAFEAQERFDEDHVYRVDEARERDRWRQIVAASLPEVDDIDACFRELWDHFSKPDAWVVHSQAAEVIGKLRSRHLILGIASNFDNRLRGVLRGISELEPLHDRCVISSH